MLLMLLAAQAATPAPAVAPTSFSILVPVENERCARGKGQSEPGDIVVCGGRPLPSQKLPYPEQIVPDSPQPSNPDLRGTTAMALEETPCAGRSGGCAGGIDLFGAGTTLVRLARKAVAPGSCCEREGEATNIAMLGADIVKGVGHAFRKKPDTSKRVAIDLDAPQPTGRVLP